MKKLLPTWKDWLLCEEKLDDCKKLKQKEKAKFDDILRKLKNK